MISLSELMGRMRAIWRPGLYHGHGKKRDFFEGWYYKLVDASGHHPVAVIPGVFLAADQAESHAFIQVLYGFTGQSEYHMFCVDDFSADPNSVRIQVANSEFSLESIELRLDSELVIAADVEFADLTPWPSSMLSPGIMGPFGLVPRMQCYHGVLSMDHEICGQIQTGKCRIDLAGGRGYIEKDWGRGFPEAWIWLQCNHFKEKATSLTLSVASVPWSFTSFRGFLIGFLHDGHLHVFTTYNGARVQQICTEGDEVFISVSRGRLRLEVWAERGAAGVLLSPEQDAMKERVSESLSGSVCVRLMKDADVLYEGAGHPAAIEITGDVS